MQTMSDKEFDELFRVKFGSFEAEPSDRVWGRISGELKQTQKKTLFSPAWMAAASIVLVIGAGIWFSKPSETIKLRATTSPQQVAKTTVTPSRPTQVKEAAGESFFRKLSSLKISRDSQVKYLESIKSRKRVPEQEQLVNGPEVASRNDQAEVLSYVEEPQISVAPPATVVMHDSSKPVLALANVENDLKESATAETERSGSGIRSVGDLVNFVVAKVDKRKDKVIEFSENDEGTLISGINLGLFKIKTKTAEDKQN